MMREIAADCRYFRGDRPCTWHKRERVLCRCDHYEAVTGHLLVIKLDAMGDVLRSTSLLPALAATHPGMAITWITRRESVPLLSENPYVAEVLELGPEVVAHLSARRFDRIINLDAGRTSAALAATARGAVKDGFVMDERGRVVPTNAAAAAWFEMGLFDDLKQQGRETYQTRMLAILGLLDQPHRYVFQLRPPEEEAGRQHLAGLGVDPARPVIGLNTGAGGRWSLKQWREDGYLELISRLARRTTAQFVLLGGPGERERNERLKSGTPVALVDPGCENPVRHFAALVRQCDVVVTGDTLAMHLAIALERRLVVMFGPTSAPEIDLYELGEKVIPDMSCLGCYKGECDFVPNCMDLISVSMVEQATMRQLALVPRIRDAAALR